VASAEPMRACPRRPAMVSASGAAAAKPSHAGVTPEDADEDLLRSALLAFENQPPASRSVIQ